MSQLDPTDADLLRRVRNRRNKRAWSVFSGLYYQFMVEHIDGLVSTRRCKHQLYDDVLSEAWARLVRIMPRFRYDELKKRERKDGTLKKTSFRAYVRTIVWHVLYDHSSKPLPGPLNTDLIGSDDGPPEWELREHIEFHLAKIARRRKPEFVVVWWLRTIEGKSVSEVCSLMGMEPPQVSVAWSRVNGDLRDEFGGFECL